MPRVCPYSDDEILSAFDSSKSVAATANKLGIARSTVYDRIKSRGGKKSSVTPDVLGDKLDKREDGDSATVLTRSPRIKTVKQALEYAEIDCRIWEVDRVVINSWEVAGKFGNRFKRTTLWQVKVWLKRALPKPVTNAIDGLCEYLSKHKPKSPTPPKCPKDDRHLLEVSLFDSHFGKFAWGKETGTDYDLKISEQIYFNAVEDLLRKSKGYNIDRVLYPIGNDFFHVDNWQNTTARGTPQDVDTRFQKIFDVGCKAVIHAIDRCLRVAPVEVIWVPGNHDPATSFYMAKVVAAWFRQNKHVFVDDGPKERKYVHYGATLLGFTHGDEEKHSDLPAIMAGEVPRLWADTTHREWHLGHYHKRKETRYSSGDTHTGVPVVVLPSLSGTDKWHYKKGYVNARRAAVAYLWSHNDGYSGHFNSNCVT
jgi:hypothetical protein